MYEIIKIEGNLFALRAHGDITIKDYDYVYQQLIPKLEELIEKYGKINCLIDLREVDSVSSESWLEELKLSFKYRGNCRRIAIIGKKTWMDEFIAIIMHILNADCEFFDSSDESKAWDWVRNAS